MSSSGSQPLSPDPVTSLGDDGLPAYVSNGVVGLRVPGVPWVGGLAVLNGLAGVHPVAAVECVPPVPYPLGGDLRLDGVWMSAARDRVRPLEQRYDFGCGELTSRFEFRVGDSCARVTMLTFASRTEPTVVVQEAVVETDSAADVELRAVLSPETIPGSMKAREQGVPGGDSQVVDGAMRWCPSGDISSAGLAYSTEFLGTSDVTREFSQERVGPLNTTYRFRTRAGRRYRFRQYVSLVPERVHDDVDRQATRLVALAVKIGFDRLRESNHDAWRELWKGRIVLLGADPAWQALADAAYFYLHTSVHSSSLASSNIFGLTQWGDYHYYYGHVMWDIEAFAVPPLLLTQPHAARALLDYRTRSLDAARYNAVQWGYRGAQFPWQSSPLFGQEAAPELGSAAMYEHHVSMGVAHACAQYVHATGDERFLFEQAWRVQAEVAEWITSRVDRSPRGFEIRQAMGIAERETPSDNVAYVNMAAVVALDDAIRSAETIGRHVPPSWGAIRDGLVIPMNGDVIIDHDGYHRRVEKGATPAAVCGLFPLGYRAAPAVRDATIRFYLDMADDYIGSPMLSALYGAWAAMLGDRTASARLFDEGYAKFVSPRFMNTHEYRADKHPDQPVAGPFTANIGGFLTALLYGLTGIRLSDAPPTEWPQHPVVMPDGWDGIEVERIWARGCAAHLLARHGDQRASIDVTGDGLRMVS